jgi:membrane protease YdiL (CAAX protease family)
MAYRDLAAFIAASFTLATLADALILTATQGTTTHLLVSRVALLWGVFRMYTPTIGAALAIRVSGKSVIDEFRSYFNPKEKAIYWYFLAPLIAYLAVGIYMLLGLALNILDLEKPVEMIAEQAKLPVEAARAVLLVQLVSAYLVALTLNAFCAVGEEIGWRGYLYKRLGYTANARNTLIIGAVWGLWHATAIGLLGHNYPVLRWMGVPIFAVFCIILSALMLSLVSRAGSILPSVSLHGALNALWGLTILTSRLEGAAGELLGGNGLLGLASLTTVCFALSIFLKTKRDRVEA